MFLFQSCSELNDSSVQMADLGFTPVEGTNSKSRRPLFSQVSPENWMKMKEFGRGGAHPWHPFRSAIAVASAFLQFLLFVTIVIDQRT